MKTEMESEKGKMKRLLWNWGSALERFTWKEEELEKMQEIYELQRKIWEDAETEKVRREQKRIEEEYTVERRKLRMEMVEILKEKAWVDSMISRLGMDEQTFVQLRFDKGYGFDYIGIRMHLSRATLFRMQERVLEKMISFSSEAETD